MQCEGVNMSNEEVQEEQRKNEASNTEDDIDSLMDELEEQQTKTENNEGSEDLSSLVTEKSAVADENLDQMLESASDSSTPETDVSSDEEGVDLK